MQQAITSNVLYQIAPNISGRKGDRQAEIIAGIAEFMPLAIALAELNNNLRLAHFLSQIAHESDGFCTTREYASGKAYEGRQDLGNTVKGYGVKYRGRGLIQLTGFKNVEAFHIWANKQQDTHLHGDYINYPERLEQFPAALISAVWFWNKHKLNQYADQDNLEAITRKINGGTNGLSERQHYLAKAKQAIDSTSTPVNMDAFYMAYIPLIGAKSHGQAVKALQTDLKQAGYFKTPIDGISGPSTVKAIKCFQQAANLPVDGLAGANVLKALYVDLRGKDG